MIASSTAQGVITLQLVLLSFLVQVPRELGGDYGFGQSASDMAYYTSPAGVIYMAICFLVGWLAERRGTRLPMWVGFALAAVGSTPIALLHDQPWQVVLGYFVYALCGGLISAALPNLVIAAVPAERQAVSASTVNVVGSLGSTVGVQIGFTILLTNVLTVVEGSPIFGGTGITAATTWQPAWRSSVSWPPSPCGTVGCRTAPPGSDTWTRSGTPSSPTSWLTSAGCRRSPTAAGPPLQKIYGPVGAFRR